ncbi:MAG: Trk system potassium transporter TrkA [Alphaproteobacteria bacterium]
MKIIVCGAGDVGANIARQLVYEDNDVTIIDDSESLLRSLNKTLDLKSVCGKITLPDVLEKAGGNEADMIVAVSDKDESNILCCQLANYIFNIPTKVARIKESGFLNNKYYDNLFAKNKIDLDAIISPELEVAKAIIRQLNTPGAFDSFYLGEKVARIIGISIDESCPIINTPLRMLPGIFSGLEVKILSIYRDNEIIIPSGKIEIYPGDDIYLCIKNKDLLRVLRVFGIKAHENRKVVLVGAGNIGLNIIKLIEKDYPEISCKIIDNDLERTKLISSELSNQNTILYGDALNTNLLKEAGVYSAEAIIAVSNDDETNIFSSMLAKDLGCKRSIAIVSNENYRRLSKQLNLDVLINPGNITTSAILQYVRRGKVKEVHDFGNERGEIMEIEILPTTKFTDKKISDLTIPKGVVIGGIVRNNELILPNEETVLQVKDKLIIFSEPSSIKDIERYSEVNIEFF